MPMLAMAYVLSGERKYLDSRPGLGTGLVRLPDLGTGSHRRHGPCRRAPTVRPGHRLRLVLCRPGRSGPADDPRDASSAAARPCSRPAPPARPGGGGPICRTISGSTPAGCRSPGWPCSTKSTTPTCGSASASTSSAAAMAALGPDGASHEGVGYWEYGVEYLLKFMHLARQLLGVDLYDHHVVAQHGPLSALSRPAARRVDPRQLHRRHRRLSPRTLVRARLPAARAGPGVSRPSRPVAGRTRSTTPTWLPPVRPG